MPNCAGSRPSWRIPKPARRSGSAALPAAARVRLRPASSSDFEFIYAARVLGLKEHVERIWGWDDEEDQRTRFRVAFDPSRYQIVVIDGRDVGAISVHWSGEAALIADLEMLPAWRGRGVGTALIRGVIADADARGLPVTLQVLHGNRARDLYERLGFAVDGETATHTVMRHAPPAERGADRRGIDS
jgi:GNAT superfamily N-acetyltransferase